jgi:hypothetical protein
MPPAMPPGPYPPASGPGRTNPLAVVTLVTGLIGMSVVALAVGIAALVQIRRRHERGKGMAIGGMMRPGDCFDVPKRGALTVHVGECDKPHGAQLTHRFELPAGPYPGDSAAEKRALDGCSTRWNRMFSKNPSPIKIEEWYLPPGRESWQAGDRSVLCYVTDRTGRDLTRSVVPD